MDFLCYRLSALATDDINTSVLNEQEQEMSPTRRAARALLRCEIARRTGKKPQEVIFTHNEHGKPHAKGLHFNISHSGDSVCLAFHHAPIGIDIQQRRPLPAMDKLAPRIMCAAQLERYRRADTPEDVFFTCWCVAEALIKLHGDTIWHATQYPFILHGNRVELLSLPDVRVELFTPHPGYYGAVAYKNST